MSRRVEVSSRPGATINIIGLNVLDTVEAFNPTSDHASEVLYACVVVWDVHLVPSQSTQVVTADILSMECPTLKSVISCQ